MSCKDLMIWIGTSYFKIDCGREEVSGRTCQLGPRGGAKRCYIHEAEDRGCCRRVPSIVDWAIPGESRVFLVHSGDCAEGHQGTLFGYFPLERFEIIVDPETHDSLADPERIPWDEALFQEIRQSVRRDTATRAVRWDDRRKFETKVKTKFNNQRKRFASRVAEKKVKYRRRKTPEPQESLLEELLKEIIEEHIEQLVEDWLQGKWREKRKRPDGKRTDGKRTDGIPSDGKPAGGNSTGGSRSGGRGTDGKRPGGGGGVRTLNSFFTAGEEPRACSPPNTKGHPPLPHKRTQPGAVYLVDRLTAQITDQYTTLLDENVDDTSGVCEEDLARKEALFRQAVRCVHERRARGGYPERGRTERLPESLRKKLTKRGELVLFPRPFPIIQRCPKASFRGYMRVDGDRLVEEITCALGKRQRLVKIPYCLGQGLEESMTQSQIQSYLAGELQVNQSLSGDFLKELAQLGAEELAHKGKFVLPRFGSFHLDSEGEVHFYAFQPLRDRLEKA